MNAFLCDTFHGRNSCLIIMTNAIFDTKTTTITIGKKRFFFQIKLHINIHIPSLNEHKNMIFFRLSAFFWLFYWPINCNIFAKITFSSIGSVENIVHYTKSDILPMCVAIHQISILPYIVHRDNVSVSWKQGLDTCSELWEYMVNTYQWHHDQK